jgi:hypothetical protein
MKVVRELLEDGALALEFEPNVSHLVEGWLPHLPAREPTVAAQATIEVGADAVSGRQMSADPTLSLGTVSAWHVVGLEQIVLRGRSGVCEGLIELRQQRAALTVDPGGDDAAAADVYSMLTISAAMLLSGLGRSLVHAGAVATRDGMAWLIAGDAKSGKSTVCANLISAGWAYLSDDQVVLSAEEDREAVRVEGWPRDFHLDEGWEAGAPVGSRRTVDPRSLGPGRWRRSALLAGTLLPDVSAGGPSRVTTVHPSEALTALIRQAPWLMADPVAAPVCVKLLRSAAALPTFRLSLGHDSFADPATLVAALLPVTGPSAR